MFTCLQLTTYMFNSRAATKQMTATLDIHKVLISTCECLGNPCNSSQKFLSPCSISQTCSQNYRCTCCLLQQASNTRSSGTFRGVGCRSAAASQLWLEVRVFWMTLEHSVAQLFSYACKISAGKFLRCS